MRALLSLWVVVAMLPGCTKSNEPSAPAESAGQTKNSTVTVFAAASLVTALDGIAEEYESSHNTEIAISYASSADLAQQILVGAGADIFISASLEWADEIAKSNTIARREDALGNSLVLVVPAGNRANVAAANDLARANVARIAIGDPASVPAGKYAQEALTKLALWDSVKTKLVNTMDVRQALLYAEQGEVDAAIVYKTDAASSTKVKEIESLDDALIAPVRYSLVLLDSEPTNEAASEFFEHLFSDQSSKRFEAAGFKRLPLSGGAS